jgi:3-deoxy-D-arabino-heptulosonate 7-phosphate (DAHP) synthase
MWRVFLQTAVAAETYLAEGQTLKSRCKVQVGQSLTDRRLTASKTEEQMTFFLNIKKKNYITLPSP